jgi:molybdate/tungstate transport system substrate-binding protein
MSERVVKSGISTTVTIIVVLLVVVVIAVTAIYYEGAFSVKTSATRSNNSSPLILYTADAYVSEANAFESAFTSSTGIQTVPPKSAGSLALGQQIAQGDPVSAFISVSKSAVSKSVLNATFPGWAVAFAEDQMTIAYSNATTMQNGPAALVLSSYESALSSNTNESWNNFFGNLTSGSVKVGISNPNTDPAGFRGWLVLQAAGAYFQNNDSTYFVNRMVSNHGNITGASAADLETPLVAGNIQFLFIYKSAALGAHLNEIQLPGPVNLGNATYSSFYSKFSYRTTSGVQTGGVISLFITVPIDSTNANASLAFVGFVVKYAPQILPSYGLTVLSPARLYNDSVVPTQIDELLGNGSVKVAGSL